MIVDDVFINALMIVGSYSQVSHFRNVHADCKVDNGDNIHYFHYERPQIATLRLNYRRCPYQ